MTIQLALMILAVLLTLVAPPLLANWIGERPRLRRHLTWLTLGLLLQIGAEFALMALGQRDLIRQLEGPFILVRVWQLGTLFAMRKEIVDVAKRKAFVVVILANLLFWVVVGSRMAFRLQ